jgi:hypothetical protein
MTSHIRLLVQNVGDGQYHPRTRTERNSTHESKVRDRSGVRSPALVIPAIDDLRQWIVEGYCGWCDTGGWKCLSTHTAWAHGITANNIRSMAGLFKHTPTCIVSHSARCRDRELGLLQTGAKRLPDNHRVGYKIVFSNAGQQYQNDVRSQVLKDNSNNDQRRRAAKKAGDVCRKPRPCSACGKLLPNSKRKTCSDACRRTIRIQTSKQWQMAAHTPLARKHLSEAMQRRVHSGLWRNPNPYHKGEIA